jgi:hypothetical protein
MKPDAPSGKSHEVEFYYSPYAAEQAVRLSKRPRPVI